MAAHTLILTKAGMSGFPNKNGRPEGRPFRYSTLSAANQAAAFSGANLP